jgi:general secretion pathway protein E
VTTAPDASDAPLVPDVRGADEDSLRNELEKLYARRAQPSAIIRCVLRAAQGAGASDIHFEPVDAGLDIRFRLDGVLASVAAAPRDISLQLVARLKVLAGLATYRTDTPQDGRISGDALGMNELADKGAGMRLATYPTVRGERAAVRLFLSRHEDFRLDALSLGADVVSTLALALSSREGLVALTGPAGSGKTTTIYAAIQHIREEGSPERAPSGSGARHIVTIEDPVECLLPGITQTQTNPASGLTSAKCLGAILRQDPEVIMVGEIRDRETAMLALEAALTGHLVLTTVHAGTAAGVFARLLEMGAEPYLVTSTVRAALAQRLVRRLCPECKQETDGIWSAAGCPACYHTGYRGRLPLAEIVTLSAEVRAAVLARADLDELERAARASGMRTLARRGEELVSGGETTRAEVERSLAGLRRQDTGD